MLERQVLQYQLVGTETLGKGPLVVLLDKSGSMEGRRDVWAAALHSPSSTTLSTSNACTRSSASTDA